LSLGLSLGLGWRGHHQRRPAGAQEAALAGRLGGGQLVAGLAQTGVGAAGAWVQLGAAQGPPLVLLMGVLVILEMQVGAGREDGRDCGRLAAQQHGRSLLAGSQVAGGSWGSGAVLLLLLLLLLGRRRLGAQARRDQRRDWPARSATLRHGQG